jgi:DNA-directed RNA polymerase specialized sigma24 family protein
MFLGRGSKLVWLAFLLTGDMSLGGDVVGEALDARDSTAPFFEQWMSAWCRKLVIARALGKVRLPLTASARRIKVRVQNSAYEDQLPSPAWRVGRDLSRTQFEDALLAIDIFPRCALLLRIFEKMSIEDAGLLLNADKELIESATAIALNELVWNIAIGQDWSPMEATMGGPSAQIRELAA